MPVWFCQIVQRTLRHATPGHGFTSNMTLERANEIKHPVKAVRILVRDELLAVEPMINRA